jgi:hypothetical protein
MRFVRPIPFDRTATAMLAGIASVLIATQRESEAHPHPVNPTKMINKEALASRIEHLQPNLGAILRSATTRIEQIDTPFFEKGAIYRVVHIGPHHPLVFTVGCAERDFTVLLPANPEAFAQLAAKSALQLDSDKSRVSYAIVFLESTRNFDRRFQILRRFDDIELIAKASEQEKQRYEQLRSSYGSVIRPPTIASQDGKWTIAVIALKGQDLVRMEVKLDANGNVTLAESTLEKNLPISYAK